jgi:hypothetical protein
MFVALCVLSSILWHRYLAKYVLASIIAAVSTVILYLGAAIFQAGDTRDPFVIEGLMLTAAITTPIALFVSLAVGLPFRRSAAVRRKIYLVYLVIGVAAAGTISWLSLRPPPPVTISVTNNSHKAVASVRLIDEKGLAVPGHTPGLAAPEHIPAGQTRRFAFHAGDELYTVNVRFEDDTELTWGSYYYISPDGSSYSIFISDSSVAITLGDK